VVKTEDIEKHGRAVTGGGLNKASVDQSWTRVNFWTRPTRPTQILTQPDPNNVFELTVTRLDPAQGQYGSKQSPDIFLPKMTYCIG